MLHFLLYFCTFASPSPTVDETGGQAPVVVNSDQATPVQPSISEPVSKVTSIVSSPSIDETGDQAPAGVKKDQAAPAKPPVPAPVQKVVSAPAKPVTPAPVPASPPVDPIAALQDGAGPKNITNVFTDTDLKQALGDIGAQAGVPVIADETVTGTISANLKNLPLEQALAIVLAPGNYTWVRMDSYYLVGKAEPTSPNYLRFAASVSFKPDYLSADRLATMLSPAEAPYVKASVGELTLTITAAPNMRDRIIRDLKMLDRAPTRIMMEAMVTEVSSNVLNQYSFSWLWKSFGLTNDATNGSSFTYTKIGQNDVDTLKGLLAQGKGEVRANPRIMTVEGKEATVEVAQESYFQVITGPANFPYASLQVIKTGISLKMTPILSSNGEITVQLAPDVSDAAGTTSTGLPINVIRRANTTVRVKDGETIVIGGMTYTNNLKTTNKIPILSSIPLLGALFTSHNTNLQKTDVIIMITPHIVKD